MEKNLDSKSNFEGVFGMCAWNVCFEIAFAWNAPKEPNRSTRPKPQQILSKLAPETSPAMTQPHKSVKYSKFPPILHHLCNHPIRSRILPAVPLRHLKPLHRHHTHRSPPITCCTPGLNHSLHPATLPQRSPHTPHLSNCPTSTTKTTSIKRDTRCI